jgi:threonine/homoserine/homoserine lactone efflux protein
MAPAELMAPVIGIAASPFGILPAVLFLNTALARANAAAFLGGWMAGILLAFLIAAAGTDWLATVEGGPWVNRLRAVLGVALILLALWQLSRGTTGGTLPGWMANIASSRPPAAFRLGLLLTLANPKVLLLAVAAGLGFAGNRPLIAGLLFAAVASLAVALPLLLHLLFADRLAPILARAQQWLERHHGTITAIVLLAIGAMLLGNALA